MTSSEALTSESRPSRLNELSGTCKQKRQTRRVDKATAWQLMTTRRTPRSIRLSNRRRSTDTEAMSTSPGGVKTAMSFHSFIRPWFPKRARSMHTYLQLRRFCPSSIAVYDRPRKNSRETSAMSSSSADSVKRSSSPKTLPQIPDTPSPETESKRSRSAARQRKHPSDHVLRLLRRYT